MSDWSCFEPSWEIDEKLLLREPPVEKTLEADWKALRGDTTPEGSLPRMSDEKLREFVVGVLDGTLFISAQVRDPELLPVIFMPIGMGALKGWTDEQMKEIGVLYAPMSSALERSINGYPFLTEVRFMHREDWARASKALDREWTRRKEIEI